MSLGGKISYFFYRLKWLSLSFNTYSPHVEGVIPSPEMEELRKTIWAGKEPSGKAKPDEQAPETQPFEPKLP